MKRPTLDEDVQNLIVCGQELEAYEYNKKFYGYDGKGFSVEENKKLYRRAKARATRIIGRYGWKLFEEIARTNLDLEYAMQFL